MQSTGGDSDTAHSVGFPHLPTAGAGNGIAPENHAIQQQVISTAGDQGRHPGVHRVDASIQVDLVFKPLPVYRPAYVSALVGSICPATAPVVQPVVSSPETRGGVDGGVTVVNECRHRFRSGCRSPVPLLPLAARVRVPS
jgi:hypothetical protein